MPDKMFLILVNDDQNLLDPETLQTAIIAAMMDYTTFDMVHIHNLLDKWNERKERPWPSE